MRRAAGFTLLETVLAAVIGGAIILTSVGLFSLMERTERVLDRQYTQTRQLGTLHQILRRSFNTFLMSPETGSSLQQTTGDGEAPIGTGEIVEEDEENPAWDGQGERPRIILQTDHSNDLARSLTLIAPPPGDPMGMPQRFEAVLPRSPIPSSLRLPTQGWLASGIDVENDLEVYGISGAVRGVFEFRPNGSREMLLAQAGYSVAGGEVQGLDREPGWTMWWRPIFPEEVARLNAGEPETEADILAAAIEAYPIIRGIKRARFLAFDNGYRLVNYAARTASDLPAYIELEIETWSGIYANWMFEVGWVNGADPTSPSDEPTPDAADTPEGEGVNTPSPGGTPQPQRLTPGGTRSPGSRPGTIDRQRRPDSTIPRRDPGGGNRTGGGS